MQTRIRKNESVENLIKRFTRKVKKSKILEEVLDRRYHKKPSQVRREKQRRRRAELEKQKKKQAQEKED
tara:strand:+ start:82 stop:288 length:207 start_codon:yes stop_codon:yes gene_type:complete